MCKEWKRGLEGRAYMDGLGTRITFWEKGRALAYSDAALEVRVVTWAWGIYTYMFNSISTQFSTQFRRQGLTGTRIGRRVMKSVSIPLNHFYIH